MKCLLKASVIIMIALMACDTSVIVPEHDHGEHSHPVPDRDINATILMNKIVDDLAENRKAAISRYKGEVVIVRARIEKVVVLEDDFFGTTDIYVLLENRRNVVFYIDVSLIPNGKQLFKVGQTYTFTLFIADLDYSSFWGSLAVLSRIDKREDRSE